MGNLAINRHFIRMILHLFVWIIRFLSKHFNQLASLQPKTLREEQPHWLGTDIQTQMAVSSTNSRSLGLCQLQKKEGELSFVPGGDIGAAFCQGDSGGPVFADRSRGCKPFDVISEDRPRLLEGTISWNRE
jgi:hypothetical protein